MSCDARLAGPYCHQCGEKRLDRHDYALGHFLEHTVDAFTHFDFKVPRALWSLLREPGRMTADVLAGRRRQWANPFQVFIIANLLYYLLATWLHLNTFQTPLKYHLRNRYGALAQTWSDAQTARLGVSAAEYAERFDHLAHTLAKSLVVFFVPVFAVLFGLLARRQQRYALEHLITAFHFTALALLLLLLPYPLVLAGFRLGWLHAGDTDATWTLLSGLLLGFYGSRFMRRVYNQRPGVAAGQGFVLAFGFYTALALLYRPLLFFAVHYLL